MSIMWHYLDKRGATIKVLSDYNSMKYIIESADEKEMEIRERMTSVGSPKITGLPGSHNPQAGEDRIIKAIDEIDVEKERYRQALEYMNWFMPAWEELTDDERYVLEEFYWGAEEYQTDAVYAICEHLSIERSSAYNKKNRALDKLTLLLYGK